VELMGHGPLAGVRTAKRDEARVNVRVRCGLSRQPKGDDHDRASAAADAGADTTAGPGPGSTADTARPVTAWPGPSPLGGGWRRARFRPNQARAHQVRHRRASLRPTARRQGRPLRSCLSPRGGPTFSRERSHLGSGGYWLGDARPPWH